ncbi:cardiolipin synthase [Sedimentibacter sp. MB31-C6]|uniref:cardiolipin synthase n=1 Tax=Sedimentibacter sp. MB31-C6 TaxID=3109366 RepID=UPI002DDCB7E2|nr:cardiolipin synthase [Sedimentibacter sp. MB36-C1]WSI02957.1 cardiolipin synthase [Sedimentibacter sp. MB36-C1]
MLSLIESFSIIYFINIIMAFIIIFLERKDPTATLAWVLVLFVFPGFGFIFYLLLAQNFSRKKLFKMKIKDKKTFGNYLKVQQELFNTGKLHLNDKNVESYIDILKMNLFANETSFTQNNDVEIFIDGKEKFYELFKCIERAQNHIHIEYYIIKNDNLGNRLLNLLAKKAEEGIEVKLLFDSIGGRSIPKSTIDRLKISGVKVGAFFSSNIPFFNFKINFRNHRKIVVIDGKIGFIGGFNIGDEYVGLNKEIGYWRDTHIKITGDAVIDLQTRFFLDWGHATNEDMLYLPRYFPDNGNNGKVGIQIVSSGPDKTDEVIKSNYVKMINSAKKNILIQTPYFVPDSSIFEALKIAAMSGVDVRIMIPCKPDHPFVYWASYWYCGDLLPYGVKVYTYENGFLHAKTIVVDGVISSVGTANFDIRSFKLNFEGNAIIYDTKISIMLANIFMEDLNYSIELTRELYLERGLFIRFKESISRLLAPLL